MGLHWHRAAFRLQFVLMQALSCNHENGGKEQRVISAKQSKNGKGNGRVFCNYWAHCLLNVLKLIKNDRHKDRFTLVSYRDLKKIKKSKAAAALSPATSSASRSSLNPADETQKQHCHQGNKGLQCANLTFTLFLVTDNLNTNSCCFNLPLCVVDHNLFAQHTVHQDNHDKSNALTA